MMLGNGMSLVGRWAGRGKLSILIYHQVLAAFDPLRPSEPVAEQFDWQMALLARHFTPLSLSDALAQLQAGCLPANAVCVTFDDGYTNNLTVAQPILERHGIPATVYVATAFSEGGNMWNDRVLHLFADSERGRLNLWQESIELGDWESRRRLAQHCLDELKYLHWQERTARVDALYQLNDIAEAPPMMLTPEQVRALANLGVEIGAHTVHHPILRELAVAAQREEIEQSRAQLEAWTGRPVRHFAYPNGRLGRDLDQQTQKQVREAGFQSAVITNSGVAGAGTSPWLLPRFTPWDRVPWRFQARLLRNQLAPAA
tara:strand:- start:35571 stop:36515 length:945 start_codon:yes stop_codon:yes gene_type:complete